MIALKIVKWIITWKKTLECKSVANKDNKSKLLGVTFFKLKKSLDF